MTNLGKPENMHMNGHFPGGKCYTGNAVHATHSVNNPNASSARSYKNLSLEIIYYKMYIILTLIIM